MAGFVPGETPTSLLGQLPFYPVETCSQPTLWPSLTSQSPICPAQNHIKRLCQASLRPSSASPSLSNPSLALHSSRLSPSPATAHFSASLRVRLLAAVMIACLCSLSPPFSPLGFCVPPSREHGLHGTQRGVLLRVGHWRARPHPSS